MHPLIMDSLTEKRDAKADDKKKSKDSIITGIHFIMQ